jgi:hypothetical protein
MALESKRFLMALGLALFCVAAVPLVLWGFYAAVAEHQEALDSGRQLIIISSSHGYLPGVTLGLIVLAGLAITILLFDFGRARKQAIVARAQRLAALGMVTAVGLLAVGHFATLSVWEKKAARLDYQECPPMTLLLDRLTYAAWVKDSALCYDRDVRRLVMRGLPEESKRVEAKLQARKKAAEARRLHLQQNEMPTSLTN